MAQQYYFDSNNQSWEYYPQDGSSYRAANWNAGGYLSETAITENAYLIVTYRSPIFTQQNADKITLKYYIANSGENESFQLSITRDDNGSIDVIYNVYLNVPTGTNTGWVDLEISGGGWGIDLQRLFVSLTVSSEANNDIVFRLDEVLIGTAPALTFYTGTTGLTYRSDLPDGITDIGRGGLLVRQSGAVIVGAGNANAVMLAQATSADTFASWTDITESYPAAAPITALIEVKSGSSF